MKDVERVFYKDVVGYLDYLDSVVSDVEGRRVEFFKILFMLILLRMFEDFRLVPGECVRKVLSERSLDSLLILISARRNGRELRSLRRR
jgi:hypothetical protein